MRLFPYLRGICFTAACATACGARASDAKYDLVLWYEEPAAKWDEALPIGNGGFGAMVFGGTQLTKGETKKLDF